MSTALERIAHSCWGERMTLQQFAELTIDESEAFRLRHNLSFAEMDEALNMVLVRILADHEVSA